MSDYGDELTPLQKELLQQIADGAQVKQLAGKYRLTEDAIARHASRLRFKLDARSAAHAVAIGFRKGLIK